MDSVDKFMDLFADFDMVVKPRRRETDQKPFKPTVKDHKSKSDLKKALKRLTREYKKAQKSFKANKINRQELFDFEWRIFEIQEEIKKLEEGGYNNTFGKDQDI